jgi:hypothetical protein
MQTTCVEQRLRTFLLVLAGWLCVGTIIELLLVGHTETVVQFIPFALCGVGLAAVGAALLRSRRGTLLGLRAVMAVLLAGSLFGIYEHVEGNLAFALEIRPGAAVSDVWTEALTGAAPLLAPGILALAALLALAATYAHPALQRRQSATVSGGTPAGDTIWPS